MAVPLSTRGNFNINGVIPRIPKTSLEPSENPNLIDLSLAENSVNSKEVLDILRSSLEEGIQWKHLYRSKGIFGDSRLLDALASTLNDYFHPHSKLDRQNIAIAPGAENCLDAIIYNICDPGDGVLAPRPHWDGYMAFFFIHSGVKTVGVVVESEEGGTDPMGAGLIPSLEKAYQNAELPIKALVLSNPNNPLGRYYSREVLEECLKFCQLHNLHLISDEVLALDAFQSPDLPDAPPFVSALSLDAQALGCDPDRVHVLWTMSKDLGVSGMRLGCIATRNIPLRNAISLIAAKNVSSLPTIFSTELLTSPTLPSLVQLNSERLAQGYLHLTSFFKESGIEYMPSNAGVFVLARLAPRARNSEEEAHAHGQYLRAGVLVIPGRAYSMPERQSGWMRVTFAVDREYLMKGLERIRKVYKELSQ